uniref:Uncharacterized protein n=1 Tax=Fundulus heteroclitus TaxID=8078 RepID=A0A146PNK6_FUNHE
MAEKVQPGIPRSTLLVTAPPAKKPKPRKSAAEKAATKRALDKARGHTRVYIGEALERWRQLRTLKGLKSDPEVAVYLLDRYENRTSSTPSKHRLTRPPPVSTIGPKSLSDYIVWEVDDNTRNPDTDTQSVSSLEE